MQPQLQLMPGLQFLDKQIHKLPKWCQAQFLLALHKPKLELVALFVKMQLPFLKQLQLLSFQLALPRQGLRSMQKRQLLIGLQIKSMCE